ncbi:hypothetical protein OAG1_24560 [Agarivorans sp. OAG1]|uniref:DUF4336 domain-containing protein n=1 Tax=Agarivorans sp. OAG1 TaxID=3082387 RepID=UPI002B294A86|nr:hypothetical protein OAG1_24560 [Agarivorans sp. OAG1]
MQQLAENVWVVEGPSVHFFGLPYSTRMTIIRLDNQQLWVHSPIALNDNLLTNIASLGEVKYLVAPNHLHHLFIEPWQQQFPDARLYGTEQLIIKRNDLDFDGALTNSSSEVWPWHQQIKQVLFTGSPLMQECIFYHPSSGVLIVTDLLENFNPAGFNWWQRLLARMTGIVAPNGKMPLDWRLSFMFGKAKARQHLTQILNWQANTLVMSHGEIIHEDATNFLKRSFRWLL